jgi:signal transduction histidine kinase
MMAAPPRHVAPAGDHEFAERVRALYRQGGRAGWAAVVAVVCLVAVMWRFVAPAPLLSWLALTLVAIGSRVPLLRAHARDPRRDQRAATWAGRYTCMVGAHGACWGLASVLFLDADRPFGVASFLIVAALVPTANVATQSNHLPAVHAVLLSTLAPAILRLASFGTRQYLAIAVTLTLYLGFLTLFARFQSGIIGDGIRLRHENLALIEALKTEKEHAEMQRARAEQASLAKSQFLAAASHDLRQPLHALGLFSASLRELATDRETRAVVDRIFAAIESLESLFSELLDLSRLDAGYVEPQVRDVALAPLCERLRASYEPLAQAKRLTLRLDGGRATVRSDPALLERVLGNLVSNAIRYTEQGAVTVAARPEGDTVEIEVRDTGIGIPEGYHEKIFEEFFQLGNPERDRAKGLGLGLAIVKRIATMLDVPIDVRSVVGRGSSFSLRVPAGEAARASVPPEAPPVVHDLLRGKTILVIDDEAGVRQATSDVLTRWGCATQVAVDAAQAVLVTRGRPPDVIVADLRLRDGASGLDAVEEVRRACGRAIPVLIVTGDTAVDVLREARERGHVLLHKPVPPARLRAALSQFLTPSAA